MKFPEQFRLKNPHPVYQSRAGDPFGCFLIPDGCDRLFCIASPGAAGEVEFEHVSVTVRNKRMLSLRRCPTWEQMCLVKEAFWDDTEAVMQLHPPKSEHVNSHAFCLHLWRPNKAEIPLPPSIAVGLKGFTLNS